MIRAVLDSSIGKILDFLLKILISSCKAFIFCSCSSSRAFSSFSFTSIKSSLSRFLPSSCWMESMACFFCSILFSMLFISSALLAMALDCISSSSSFSSHQVFRLFRKIYPQSFFSCDKIVCSSND